MLNMHKEKKRIDFGFGNCCADTTMQLNAYDNLLLRLWLYGGIESNIDGLHAGFTRTSPEDFDFLLALGNCQTSNIFVYHGSESPFNQTSRQQVSWRSMDDDWAYPFHSKPRCQFKWLHTTLSSLICLIVLD